MVPSRLCRRNVASLVIGEIPPYERTAEYYNRQSIMNSRVNDEKQKRAKGYKQLSQHIGAKLAEFYADITASPLPDKFLRSIERLNALDAESEQGASAAPDTDSIKSGPEHNRTEAKRTR
jgi:hypothetical protein